MRDGSEGRRVGLERSHRRRLQATRLFLQGLKAPCLVGISGVSIGTTVGD